MVSVKTAVDSFADRIQDLSEVASDFPLNQNRRDDEAEVVNADALFHVFRCLLHQHTVRNIAHDVLELLAYRRLHFPRNQLHSLHEAEAGAQSI